MNQLIADNRASTLRAYLLDRLQKSYDSRESVNVVAELFQAFHGWSRSDVVLNANQRLGESEILKYHFALKRLLQGEPLQYVLGYAWFQGMKLTVDKHVLIPRPETEELVQLIVNRNPHPNPRILDIGTGSGCIALALKKQIPGASVSALDISEEALSVARQNASSLDLDVTFMNLDILSATTNQTFDIIVSNPPYIPRREHAFMETRVTSFEPHLALFTSDDDPLIFYRRLMELSAEALSVGGQVFCEIHENMAEALLLLARQYAIQPPTLFPDLQGKNRIIHWSI